MKILTKKTDPSHKENIPGNILNNFFNILFSEILIFILEETKTWRERLTFIADNAIGDKVL